VIEHSPSLDRERTILVHQGNGRGDDHEPLEELRLLASSAGADICDQITTVRVSPHPATYLGLGKVAELGAMVAERDADLVLINHPISPTQERNLERELKCRVLDRTGLILDIFAQRAASREGQLQVELAQLRHLSTRLVRGWSHLERQKGGIGLRGPGESQLETDRRLIGQRIKSLRKRLERMSAQRALHRRARNRTPVATVCLVGYTNAGKSSLFNRLTGARVQAADQLFATLDPTMRKLNMPRHGHVVLSDTVGFIRQLPHTLIKAFHSTLEEVSSSALLLHVVDHNSPERRDHIEQVAGVLEEIGADHIPVLTVFNKIDLSGATPRAENDMDGNPQRVWVSAHSGRGIEELLRAVEQRLEWRDSRYTIGIPPRAARLRSVLFDWAVIHQETTTAEGGWVLEVDLPQVALGRLQSAPEFKFCTMSAVAPDAASALS
jgi:GTP-binding protein HflX